LCVLLLHFLAVLCLELEVGLVGGALVVAEEAAEVDLVERVPAGVVGGAAEGDVESAVGADQLEVDAVEVGADGVEVLPALLAAGEFHARLPVAEGAVLGGDLVVDDAVQDGGGCEAVSELDAVVLDFDCVGGGVPRSKRTRQVTW
jgi:hypothetical protein